MVGLLKVCIQDSYSIVGQEMRPALARVSVPEGAVNRIDSHIRLLCFLLCVGIILALLG